ncbi:MAG: hypothetical protein PHU25_12160 [Deltaproteobacteria bacterium]|nr:hypothetical protein [Deltaproteobacteria bacterium]
MKPGPITLRNLPSNLAKEIRKRASEKGMSANKAVISLLEESLGNGEGARKRLFHDLDDLFGRWGEAEAKAFEGQLARQRRIEPEVWE